MKVLQILPQLNIGGVERGTLDLSKALIQKGHESFVISGGGILVDELIQSGAKHYEIPVHIKSLKTLSLAKNLSKTISSIDPDIVHVRSRMPAWVNFRAFKMLQKKPLLISTCGTGKTVSSGDGVSGLSIFLLLSLSSIS